MNGYLLIPDTRLIVGNTPRNGSASLGYSIRQWHRGEGLVRTHIMSDEVLPLQADGYDVLVWVRETYDRLACAYSLSRMGRKFHEAPTFNNISISEFVAWVLSEDPDQYAATSFQKHWSSQVEQHTYQGKYLPTKVYPFEQYSESWAAELPMIPLTYMNKTEPSKRVTRGEFLAALTPEIKARMDQRYQKDIELYQSVTSCSA